MQRCKYFSTLKIGTIIEMSGTFVIVVFAFLSYSSMTLWNLLICLIDEYSKCSSVAVKVLETISRQSFRHLNKK